LWQRTDLDVLDVASDEAVDTHLAVRLHLFHLLQTASSHSMELDAGIPARGWHGEGYRGHIFWDELFICPLLNLHLPILARAPLLYRYRRLDEARWAARQAGFRGAMYPWQSGSDGREETDVMYFNPRSGNWIKDDAHLQRHVGAAVAYNVWQYYQATGDTEFLYSFGAELMFEIARFWASIAQWNETRGRYDICGVMGPDESMIAIRIGKRLGWRTTPTPMSWLSGALLARCTSLNCCRVVSSLANRAGVARTLATCQLQALPAFPSRRHYQSVRGL